MGATSDHIAYTLRLLAAERSASQEVHDRVELVWTGQEVVGSQSRDTSVVVRELFSTAKSSILISSFAVDTGKKAQALFGVLASRMDANLELNVRMFLNVKRSHNNKLPESTLLKEFADTFRKEIWTGQRLPEVFYDPRSLAPGAYTKACLHAKCVVVDEERLLVTSANFTEAAHERNIEAGVLIDDPLAAKGMRSQFETLVAKNILRRVPGI
jgi:phosphatidylserine/phosphatidylglycerophosphate/cardiolipin synthase-like enzyme